MAILQTGRPMNTRKSPKAARRRPPCVRRHLSTGPAQYHSAPAPPRARRDQKPRHPLPPPRPSLGTHQMAPAAALVRQLPRPARASLPNRGFGRRAGVSSLSVRAKESDDFIALVSEKPAEPAPSKRERWEGFGREVSDGDAEVQMPGESASWNVLNQIGIEEYAKHPFLFIQKAIGT
ncbi:hypothetical protein GUJ93_ZPchr0002g26173 [Zizania palustris]|uniref:Uncharacterized protein n=1 Tax=Zizania palustris TaxID=103762 RepID=A0A8J5RDB8_ZIZPA|nr:hypothetical protein GUJ93_ZPchr0002g26173 [Zizania palustris]